MRFSASSRLYTTAEIRAIEQAVLSRPNPPPLMQRAGLAAAEFARARMLDERCTSVLVLAGPGNNGGDALVAARHLKSWWYRVDVVFAGDPLKLSADAAQALAEWREAGGSLLDRVPPRRRWDLVIDGLFGLGLTRDVEGRYRALIDWVNSSRLPVLSIDIPSGLCSDTGRVRGAAVRAAATVTFMALKPGLLTLDGPDHCGEIIVDDLGLAPTDYPPQTVYLVERERVVAPLKPRPRNSHKGLFGSVGILGGAPTMVGAALLAGRAALKLGAGRVYVGLMAREAPAWDPGQPELMLRPPQALFQLEHLSCLAVGPGMGLSPEAYQWLKAALACPLPLILDADALNLLAEFPRLREMLADRGNAVLTPHPAEAARLLQTSTAAVQADRVAAARRLSEICRCAVVLKGAGSICALTDDTRHINTTGNPGMASAGMGDVLTGLIAAFVAQGLALEQALLLAVHLHGASADRCVEQGKGPVGLTAGETVEAARELLNAWINPRPSAPVPPPRSGRPSS